MSRLLPRLRDFGTAGLPAYVQTWSQRVCEKIEATFADQQAQIDAIAAAAKTSIVIDPFNTVLIFADINGTPKDGELPRDEPITASNGTQDLTKLGTWSLTDPDGITCTIGADTGILNITALAVTEVWVPVTFAYSGITRSGRVHVIRQDDPPTNAGSSSTGGTSASTSTLGDTTSSAFDDVNAVSEVIQAQAGSVGQVDLSAPISYKRKTNVNPGVTNASGKWQWRVVGGTFADVSGSTFTDSGSQTAGGTASTGQLTVTQSQTGLTNGTTYEFRFLWRSVYTSGTPAEIYRISGVMTAVGS